MGFLGGRATFERFTVGGKSRGGLDESYVQALEQHASGRRDFVADAVSVGFSGGVHILDLEFGYEKNVVNDALIAAMRVDQAKAPASLKKAYYELELAELSKDNPSGYPTKKQKAEAKTAAEERCLEEAREGKYLSMKDVPFLWDHRQDVVYFGSSSNSTIERFVPLFQEAFGRPLERLTAGSVAHEFSKELKVRRAYEDASPTAFTNAFKNFSVSWLDAESASKDFFGNEFLLWLWWVTEDEADSIRLPDESTVACMMANSLTLECPMAETGKETISHEIPVKLPESKHAVRLGKLPRKSGLTLIRHDESYTLALAAETLAVGSASFPKLESQTRAEERSDRVDQLRHLTETLDLLYKAFVTRRLSDAWAGDVRKIKAWLKEE